MKVLVFGTIASFLFTTCVHSYEFSLPSLSVGTSPWGAQDEIGRLNMLTKVNRKNIMSRANYEVIYDVSVDYFVGMPSWQAAGDPTYQIWMTHTPNGSIVDNVLKQGKHVNSHVSYSGTAISMYTHTGTHIDALSHFGLDGKIYNHFTAQDNLGDKGWKKSGADKIPPIIGRGILLDIPSAKRIDALPDNYRISKKDLIQAADFAGIELIEGDIVLIRTGRMQQYTDSKKYMTNSPGLGIEAAQYLASSGVAIVGADNLSFEAFPSEVKGNYVPVHTYLLAQEGVHILELVYLEDLSKNSVYEFAFIGGSLKLRGADAAPMRPIAIPLFKTHKDK